MQHELTPRQVEGLSDRVTALVAYLTDRTQERCPRWITVLQLDLMFSRYDVTVSRADLDKAIMLAISRQKLTALGDPPHAVAVPPHPVETRLD